MLVHDLSSASAGAAGLGCKAGDIGRSRLMVPRVRNFQSIRAARFAGPAIAELPPLPGETTIP